MGGVFSSKKKGSKISDEDKAVLTLKVQRRKLAAERKRLEEIMDRETLNAKDLVRAGKKDRAMLQLRRRKMHEGQAARADQWMINVEELLANIETAKRQNKLFGALKEGNDAIKQLQKEVTVEQAEQLMADSKEAQDEQERMAQVLAQSLTSEQDAEVQKEFEGLEQQLLQKEADQLPAAPTHKVEVPTTAVAEPDPVPVQQQPAQQAAKERVAIAELAS